MNTQPKLIILYGFAASGKTTLAKKYVEDHPLSMAIEGDEIIAMMGQWRKFEKEARELVYKHTLSIIRNHLSSGYTVILPYLLTNATHIDVIKEMTNKLSCSCYEVYLKADKEGAIARLLERGTWGEVGSPVLTDKDMPEIEELYDRMEKEMEKITGISILKPVLGNVDATYHGLLEVLA